MSKFISRYATPLTTGLFIVSAVSGIALFFHLAQGAFHEMHEWLSMLLLLPFAFHIWKNWAGLVGYAKRKTLVLPILACLLVAVPFVISAAGESGHGGNPAFALLPLMTHASVAQIAPILKTTPDALLTVLKARGYTAPSTDQTLDDIATASGEPAEKVLFSVMPGR